MVLPLDYKGVPLKGLKIYKEWVKIYVLGLKFKMEESVPPQKSLFTAYLSAF